MADTRKKSSNLDEKLNFPSIVVDEVEPLNTISKRAGGVRSALFNDSNAELLLSGENIPERKADKFPAAVKFAKDHLIQFKTTESSLFIRTAFKSAYTLSVKDCDTILEVIQNERTKLGLENEGSTKEGVYKLPSGEEFDLDSESGRTKIMNYLAENYIRNHTVISLSQKLLVYKEGIYEISDEVEEFAKKYMNDICEGMGLPTSPKIIKGAIEIVKIRSVVSIQDCEKNNDNVLILGNGTLDIKTWEFREFDANSHKNVYFSKIPTNYNKDAAPPVNFLDLMDKAFKGRPVDRDVLQELFGYCLTRNYKYQSIFQLIGDGGNGKGTVIKILETLVGANNVSHSSMFQLSDHHNSEYFLASLHGKFANINGDEGKRTICNTENLKKLTSNTDTITGRSVREKPLEFVSFAKLIFAPNKVAEMSEATYGEKRRIQIIAFVNRISESEGEIKDFHQLVIKGEEMEGVLGWAIEGLKRLEANGDFSDRRSVSEKYLDIQNRSCPMEAFLIRCIDEDATAVTPSGNIYAAYETFRKIINGPELDQKQIKEGLLKECKDSGWNNVNFKRETVGKLNRTKFSEIFEIGTKVSCFLGIKLVTPEPQRTVSDFRNSTSSEVDVYENDADVYEALKKL